MGSHFLINSNFQSRDKSISKEKREIKYYILIFIYVQNNSICSYHGVTNFIMCHLEEKWLTCLTCFTIYGTHVACDVSTKVTTFFFIYLLAMWHVYTRHTFFKLFHNAKLRSQPSLHLIYFIPVSRVLCREKTPMQCGKQFENELRVHAL